MILKLGYEDARARVCQCACARVYACARACLWRNGLPAPPGRGWLAIDGNVTTPPSGRLARGRRLPLTSVKRANQPGQDTLRKDPQQENRLAHTWRYVHIRVPVVTACS
jgi:hypothetical protein